MLKISAAVIGTLFGVSVHALYKAAANEELPLDAGQSFLSFSETQSFTYHDALMIELTRQLHDDGGVSPVVASKFIWNSIGSNYAHDHAASDRWIAMVRWRNTWGAAPRGSFPVTLFGPNEYWSTAHFAGSLQSVQADIAEAIDSYSDDITESDAARILMANVSAADRRLRKRAATLGVAVTADGNFSI